MRQLLAEMDSAELSEWMAYDRIEPLPDSYWQAGMIAATVVNCHRSKGKAARPQDFMPARRRPAARGSIGENKAKLSAFFAKFQPKANP